MPTQEYEIITGIAVAVLVFLLGAVFIVVFILYLNNRKKIVLEQKEAMRQSFEAELLKSQLEIRDQTAANISQEIHDNIAQSLTLAKLNLTVTNPEDAVLVERKMNESRELVGKAIQDLRDLAKTLSGAELMKFNFTHELVRHLETIARVSGLDTEVIQVGEPYELDPGRQLILFRIIQEAFGNAVKHANATKLILRLNYKPTTLFLSVEDNGIGFGDLKSIQKDIEDWEMTAEKHSGVLKAPGLGLRNMESRATLLGGKLDIKTSSAAGTQLLFTIPINTEPK